MRPAFVPTWVLGAGAAVALALGGSPTLGCVESDTCTEIGCDDEIALTLSTPIDHPYELALDIEDGLLVRCNDPATPDPGHGVSCDRASIVLRGPVAARTSLQLSAVSTITGELVFPLQTVELSEDPSVSPVQPNGPSCPPICRIRAGVVETSSAG